MSLAWKLRLFRWVYVAFIVQASIDTVFAGQHGTHAHAPHLLAALVICEVVGALVFLIEPVELYGAGLLILVYSAATVLAAHSGEWTLRFVYYAATALFIVASARGTATAARATS